MSLNSKSKQSKESKEFRNSKEDKTSNVWKVERCLMSQKQPRKSKQSKGPEICRVNLKSLTSPKQTKDLNNLNSKGPIHLGNMDRGGRWK